MRPTPPALRSAPLFGLALGATLLLSAGCASVRPAEPALPKTWASPAVEVVTLDGLSGRRSGELQVAGQQGRFERSASGLTLFEAVGIGRSSADFSFDGVAGRCRGSVVEGERGLLAGALKPLAWTCTWDDGARLTLNAARLGSALGTRDERSGRYEHQGRSLALASVHELEGSRLPVAEPVAYLVRATNGSGAVGAVSLTDTTKPRITRPASATEPQRADVTRIAIALSLLWTPDML